MATRLYLHNTAVSSNTDWGGNFVTNIPAGPRTANTWIASGSTTGRKASQTPGSSQTSQAGTTSATANQSGLCGMWLSPPLRGSGTISGQITVNAADSESNAASNFFINQLDCYLWRPSTSSVVSGGILSSNANISGATEGGTSETVSTGTVSPSSVTYQDGDIIVCELGSNFSQSMATSYTATIYYDGGTESVSENAAVSDHAAFVQFSENLHFYPDYSFAGGAPYIRGVGDIATSTGSTINVSWPAGHAAGDVGILCLVTNINATVPTAPSGWTLLDYYTPAASNVTYSFYYKTATSSSEADAVPASNSQAVGQIITYQNGGTPTLTTQNTVSGTTATFTGSGKSGLTTGSMIVPALLAKLSAANVAQRVKNISYSSGLSPAIISDISPSATIPFEIAVWAANNAGTSYGSSTISMWTSAGGYYAEIVIPPAPAGSVGAGTGTVTVAGDGKATTNAAGSGAGTTPTASAAGQSTAAAAGSAVGTCTVSGAGSQLKTGAGSVAGTCTVTATGIGANQAVGAAAGTCTVSAAGKSTANSVASASGSVVASATGTGLFPAVGSASGTNTTAGASGSGIGAGSASGTCTVSATGLATTNAIAAASGTCAVAATAVANSAGAGTVVGNGNLNGVGRSTANSVGAAAGTVTVTAPGIAATTATGSATGTTGGGAVGKGIVNADGTGAGSCSVGASGVAAGQVNGAGTAVGVCAIAAISDNLGIAVGNIECISIAQALGRQVGWAKGVHGPANWVKEESAQ